MPAAPLDRNARRTAARLTYANALVWAVGNGLVSTTLVVWLAIELGARGIAISFIIASPRLAGVLRLATPQAIAAAEAAAWRVAGGDGAGWGRKAVCLGGYALSSATLVLVPIAALAAKQLDGGPAGSAAASSGGGGVPGGPIAVLIAAWCVYHLLEYAATVALWSWIGDVYPPRLRARLLGWRERWLVIGRVVGIGASVALAALWGVVMAGAVRWVPLAASASIGAVMMIAAVLPLAWLPAMAAAPSARPRDPWRATLRAFGQPPFRRLLAYSCWLGLANGLTQSAQSLYASRVLGIGYAAIRSMQAAMYQLQALVAPRCGAWIQRRGAKRVMLPAQLIVALGPLCYWAASPDAPLASLAWLVAAHLAWVAYAPINVGLDTLKLDLADPRNNAPSLAVYHTLSDLVNALMVIAGGAIYDVLAAGDERSLRVFGGLFLAGWALRSLGAGFIVRLEEVAPDRTRELH